MLYKYYTPILSFCKITTHPSTMPSDDTLLEAGGLASSAVPIPRTPSTVRPKDDYDGRDFSSLRANPKIRKIMLGASPKCAAKHDPAKKKWGRPDPGQRYTPGPTDKETLAIPLDTMLETIVCEPHLDDEEPVRTLSCGHRVVKHVSKYVPAIHKCGLCDREDIVMQYGTFGHSTSHSDDDDDGY